MDSCSDCQHYNHGRGQKTCLRCQKYKTFQIKSVRRLLIRTEHLPDAILDNIADPRTRELIDIIRQLPDLYAVPLVMAAVLDRSPQEISQYHRRAKTTMVYRIRQGIKIIEASLRSG